MKLVSSLLLFLTFSTSANDNLSGFRGLVWRTPVPEQFVFQKKLLSSDVYVNPDERLQAGELPLRAVTYYFSDGFLHAGEINVDSDHCDLFEQVAFKKFGEPAISDERLGVVLWNGDTTHVRFVSEVGGCSLHYRAVMDIKEEQAVLM